MWSGGHVTVVQGVPTFLFALYGLLTPFGDTQNGMIVLSMLAPCFDSCWVRLLSQASHCLQDDQAR